MGYIIMSKKESQQVSVMEQLNRNEISQEAASLLLGLSTRQIRRKKKRYLEDGSNGLVHKNRGRKSSNSWKKREEAIALIKTHYSDFGPTFAAEKLNERHGIEVSKETLRKAMSKAGIWKPKQLKSKHRKWREPKPYEGQLIQLDGSNHDWFEGRGPRCDLLVFVDDATSKVYAEFAPETTLGVMSAMRNYFEQYGLPVEFYVDNHTVYKVNTNNPDGDKKTQVERALNQLGVKIKPAGSPQAKGRVERSNKTHQDRLVKELRLDGISSLQEANQFLKTVYLPKHNAKFAKTPAKKENMHRSCQEYDLEDILAIKENRIVNNDFTIQYKKRFFQIHRQNNAVIRPKDVICVNTRLDQSIYLTCRNFKLKFNEIKQRIPKEFVEKMVSQKHYKPAPNHPWRQYQQNHQIPKNQPKMEVIYGT
jgi:transposase